MKKIILRLMRTIQQSMEVARYNFQSFCKKLESLRGEMVEIQFQEYLLFGNFMFS